MLLIFFLCFHLSSAEWDSNALLSDSGAETNLLIAMKSQKRWWDVAICFQKMVWRV